MGATLQKLAHRKTKMLITKNKQPPELHNLQENDIRFITSILLQVTQKSSQEKQSPGKHRTYQCPTCPYKGEKEEHLIRHRQKKETCKKTWEQEKNQGRKCPNDECKGTFRNKNELGNTKNTTNITPRKIKPRQISQVREQSNWTEGNHYRKAHHKKTHPYTTTT